MCLFCVYLRFRSRIATVVMAAMIMMAAIAM